MAPVPAAAPPLFGRRKFWARRLGVAPFLPTSRAEMDALGWDQCDVIIVTGDAYVDHVSFGAAVIGRVLEHQGFRVGVLAQPDLEDPDSFLALGTPNLLWGVTGGNMDSQVNHYTSDRKRRSDDAYTPGGVAGKRPDRAVITYSQRCRAIDPQLPVIIGGIEASLRRIAHYDYWDDRVRRSVLLDSGADLLLYGSAERAIVERGRSLLPAGVVRVEGTFRIGDSVACVNARGQEVARGLASYSSADVAQIAGRATKEIERVLGSSNGDEIIHRDDLVLLRDA